MCEIELGHRLIHQSAGLDDRALTDRGTGTREKIFG